jgi:hypothetical protein
MKDRKPVGHILTRWHPRRVDPGIGQFLALSVEEAHRGGILLPAAGLCGRTVTLRP